MKTQRHALALVTKNKTNKKTVSSLHWISNTSIFQYTWKNSRKNSWSLAGRKCYTSLLLFPVDELAVQDSSSQKLLKPVTAYLHSCGFISTNFSDDTLSTGNSELERVRNVKKLDIFRKLGLVIHPVKSILLSRFWNKLRANDGGTLAWEEGTNLGTVH